MVIYHLSNYFFLRNDLDCLYEIDLQHLNQNTPIEVCFIFHRFNTEECGSSQIPHDYIEFQAGLLSYFYCGNGHLYSGDDSLAGRHHVWTSEFCFRKLHYSVIF